MPKTEQPLRPIENRVINALLVSNSNSEAARKAKVHRNTVAELMQKPAVANTLVKRQAEQSDKSRGRLKRLEGMYRKVARNLEDAVETADLDLQTAGSLLKLLSEEQVRQHQLLDLAGESVEEQLTRRDHQDDKRRRAAKLVTVLRWASRNPARARRLAQDVVSSMDL